MWTEIEEWRPDINLYNTFFSWQISPVESAKILALRKIQIRPKCKHFDKDTFNKEEP